MMFLKKSISGAGLEKSLKITYVALSEAAVRRHIRSSVCLRSALIPALSQVVSLSAMQMKFYRIGDCVPVRVFQDRGVFVDFAYMPCIYRIAIAKQNRQVVFYDIRTNEKHPFVISASLYAAEVPRMGIGEARIASRWCHRRRIPLFNTPTAICAVPDEPTLFVGDETGRIEVFTMFMSRDAKHDWEASLVHSVKMHRDAVVQVTHCPGLDRYVSAASDGTIVVWRFDGKVGRIERESVFREPARLGIRSFVYDARTRDVVYTTTAHCFGVWRVYTTHQQTVVTNSQIIATLAVFQMSADNSFLIYVTQDNFVAVYRMPGMEPAGSWYMGLQHELRAPTGAVIFSNYLFLVGAFMSCWKIENAECDGLTPHSARMVTVLANDIFRSVISIDRRGDVNNWSVANGAKQFSYNVGIPGVTCAALDLQKRRLGVGYSDGRLKIVAANTGSELCEIDKTFVDIGCACIEFAAVFGKKAVLVGTGSKAIVMFEDISGNRCRYWRSFVGHQDALSMATVIKGNLLVSVGLEHEMFLWNILQQNPIMKFQLPDDPTVVVDLAGDPNTFIAGDVAGGIHFLTKDSPRPYASINAFGLAVKSPITTMSVISPYPLVVAGNGHGYVKYWMWSGSELREIRRFRAHGEPVRAVSISQQRRVVATMGGDEMIRLWSVEPFGMIGAFGTGTSWQANHVDTWESRTPLDDDPVHFIARSELAIEAARGATREEEEKEEPREACVPEIEVTPFSFGELAELLDSREDICIAGREATERARKRAMPPSYPLTTRSPRRVVTYTDREDFGLLVKNKDIDETLKSLKGVLARGKIVRPVAPDRH